MGWPVVRAASKYAKLIPDVYHNMHSDVAATKLSGNGMTLHQIAAWSLYLLSHLVRKDALQQWHPPLRPPDDSVPKDEQVAEKHE